MRTLHRRRFLRLAAAPLLAPLAGHAQESRVIRVGILRATAAEAAGDAIAAFWLAAMHDLGYVEGKNLVLEARAADGKGRQVLALARELAAARVDLIFTIEGAATRAAKTATASIPILFFGNFDPVKLGFAASLEQPGANLTGVVLVPDGSLTARRVELLAQTIPGTKRMAMLVPIDPTMAPDQVAQARKSATPLGIDVIPVEVRDGNYRDAFDKIAKFEPQSLLVAASTLFVRDRKQIVELAARFKLPAMYEWADQVDEGGLMAYGPGSLRALYTQLAADAKHILEGAKPGDIPIARPGPPALSINLRTAKMLRLTIPDAVLQGARTV